MGCGDGSLWFTSAGRAATAEGTSGCEPIFVCRCSAVTVAVGATFSVVSSAVDTFAARVGVVLDAADIEWAAAII